MGETKQLPDSAVKYLIASLMDTGNLAACPLGATVGGKVRKRQSKINFGSPSAIWRIARAAAEAAGAGKIPMRKRKVLDFIACRIAAECGLTELETRTDPRFVAIRSDILALAFPDARFKQEMLAAFDARRPIEEVVWIARGKPKDPRARKRVVAEFRTAIQRALHTQYTDQELRELFELALRQT
jgi:hypothetical protein